MSLVECVPNFSEGRDRKIVDEIVAAIAAVPTDYAGSRTANLCWSEIRLPLLLPYGFLKLLILETKMWGE